MEFALLGPVEVRAPDPIDVGGRHLRTVLAVLLVAEGRTVATEVLLDAVWGDARPASAAAALQTYVSRLRRALGPAGRRLTHRQAGYRLDVDPTTVDVHRFEVLAERVRAAASAGDLVDAVARSDAALALWRGPPLADVVPGRHLDAVASRLEQRRLTLIEDRAAARLGLGAHRAVAGELPEVADAHPLREEVRALLALALYRSGRQGDALAVIADTRATLREELGIDPGPRLVGLEGSILRQDPELDHRDPGAPVPGMRPRALVAAPDPATGHAPVPEVRYARVGRIRIAYQVTGEGPRTLVWLPGLVSNLELIWEDPRFRAFVDELGRDCRVVLVDKRGTGLSDPVPIDAVPDLTTRVGDVTAVLDDLEVEDAVVLGFSEGGTMAVRLAASAPDRVAGLVLFGAFARAVPGDGHPHGWTQEQSRRRAVLPIQRGGFLDPRWIAPSYAEDPAFRAWYFRYHRQAASPGVTLALLAANAGIDVRDDLARITAPTLVLHRVDDALVEVGQGRVLAAGIPRARLVALPGADHWPWLGDPDPVLTHLRAFLADLPAEPHHRSSPDDDITP